jgi:peptide methionine sulfoxide reductase msrA/msrB
VSTNVTGHVETVEVVYDPNLVNYDALLETFWRQVDPTDAGGQFVDRGSSYRPVIWYANEKERAAAQSSKDALARSGRFKKPLTIEILPAKPFYAAEEYHQDYYRKNAIRYKYYRYRSGRDRFLDATWGSDRAK